MRGIATGCTLRRLVARTLAKQFAKNIEEGCALFQYALSTRAGTDCVGHFLRAATDTDPQATILSVDGIGAYDHVLQASMLGRLARMLKARAILHFVRLSCASPSEYSWVDESGRSRTVQQAEGGEQGNTLMPFLFSVSIQDALEEVALSLHPREQFDDMYLVCQPNRVVTLFEIMSESLITVVGGTDVVWRQRMGTGLGPKRGKRRASLCWGLPSDRRSSCWKGSTRGSRQNDCCGMPSPRCQICNVPGKSWCKVPNPRANHTLRTLPPSLSHVYGEAHDAGIWNTGRHHARFAGF